MKYLMGLIITFAMGASVMGQDLSKNDNVNARSNGNLEKQDKASMKKKDKQRVEMSGAEEQGAGKGDSLIRFKNGSAEYTKSPASSGNELPKESSDAGDVNENDNASSKNVEAVPSEPADAEMKVEPSPKEEQEYTAPSSKESSMAPQSSESGLDLHQQCALNNELDNREGSFKEKKDFANGELSLKREKDGEEKIKYVSDSEFYRYDKNEKGKEKYSYGTVSDNEAMEIRKHEDGTAEVFYHGIFADVNDANQALTEGLQLNKGGSVCSTGLPQEDINNQISKPE